MKTMSTHSLSSHTDGRGSGPGANTPTQKLEVARQELGDHLLNISNQLDDGEITLTITKSDQIALLHAAPQSHIHPQSSLSTNGDQEFDEGILYRCKCTFQIVLQSFLNGDTTKQDITDCDTDDVLIYVTREDGNVVPLPNGIFPPANIRIRKAMDDLIECLNRKYKTCDTNDGDTEMYTYYAFDQLRTNLTSVTFITSWGGGDGDGGDDSDNNDCLVTLHYGPPGLPNSCYDMASWKNQASALCNQCHYTSVTGRSKGTKITVLGSLHADGNVDASISEEGIIHDDLWLSMEVEDGTNRVVGVTKVSLVAPSQNAMLGEGKYKNVNVQYQKPATAFQHPNAGVMLTSLHWILNVLSNIVREKNDAAEVIDTISKPRMLEMYCGCGAHTIPLAKSTLLSEIVAVELDERLVNACKNNCRLNGCLKSNSSLTTDASSNHTFVEVFKGDAAEWAAKTLRRHHREQSTSSLSSQSKTDNYNNFDILLVDPPRDGLDKQVCDMALQGTFQHVIYVSCGRRALLRDLTMLCGKVGGFDVVDLAVIDLFPGTDAVESLVHLKRR